MAAGRNRNAPHAMVNRPVTMVRWYPILFTILDHGTENRKYAEKNAN